MKEANGGEALLVKSLNIFTQASYLKNFPVVHECGKWLDYTQNIKPLFDLSLYFSLRLSQFWSYKNFVDLERFKALQRAARLGTEFADLEGLDFDINEEILLDPVENLPMPNADEPYYRTMDPRFLIGASDLNTRVCDYVYDNFSIHLLDIGVGDFAAGGDGKQGYVGCLLTFHRIDKETDAHRDKLSLDLDKQARAGIVGRIIWGVVQKLFCIFKQGGTTPSHGEMADSSAYLALMLINLMNNFSMDTLSQVETWIARLEEDMEVMAVTKHSFHLEHLRKICAESDSFVKPFHHLIEEMTYPADFKIPKKIRIGQAEDHLLNREVVFPYLGPIGSTTLQTLLEGNQQIEMKGTDFWIKKIERHIKFLDRLELRYTEILYEKRNFWGFVFTLVSLLMWPASNLLGYYGMNFDNMTETSNSFYFPLIGGGFHYFWFLFGLIYVSVFMFMIERRILYLGT